MGTDTEQAFHQLCPLGAHQAAYAEDFAFAQLEADVPEGPRIDGGKILHLKHHFSGNVFPLRIQVGQFPAHHQGNDLICSQFTGFPGTDVFTIPHDADFIGNAEDFIHLVGDIHNSDVFRFQVLDNPEQGIHLVGCQGGGGLVQNQHPAVG